MRAFGTIRGSAVYTPSGRAAVFVTSDAEELAALEGASEETADGAVEEVPQQMQTHQDGVAIFTAMFELALWKLVRA